MSGPVTKEGLIQLENSLRRLEETIKSLPKEERLPQYKNYVVEVANAFGEMSPEERDKYEVTPDLIAAAKKLNEMGVEHHVFFSFSGIPHLAITADPAPKKKSLALDVLRKQK